MSVEDTVITPNTPPTLAQQANAARNAVADEAKAENLLIVAELSDGTAETHIAEHIQGMVAATMGHLSADASATINTVIARASE